LNRLVKDKKVFDRYAVRYDRWFERYPFAYRTELETLHKLIPVRGRGLEVGVGTGRFAGPLGISIGVDPSERMLAKARERGISTILANCEQLPFTDREFFFVLLMVTICFVKDADLCIHEIWRVLRKRGKVILGIIDRNSPLSEFYRKRKDSPFYKAAKFYSTEEIIALLERHGFGNICTYQSLFKMPQQLKVVEKPEQGFGKGNFVAIRGEKK